jgi:hypothetical protein
MHAYLGEQAGLETRQTPIIDEIHQEITLFRERFGKRLSHLGELPLVPGFVYAKLAEGKGPYHPLLVFGLFIGITLLAFVAERAYRRGAKRLYGGLALPEDAQPLRRLGRMLARLCLDLIGVVVFAASILGMFFLLYQGHEPTRLTVMTLCFRSSSLLPSPATSESPPSMTRRQCESISGSLPSPLLPRSEFLPVG